MFCKHTTSHPTSTWKIGLSLLWAGEHGCLWIYKSRANLFVCVFKLMLYSKCCSLVKAWHSNIVQGFRKHVIYKQKARSGKKETQFRSYRIEKGSKRERMSERERQQKQSSCFVHIYKWHGRNCVGYVHGTNRIEFNCDNICIIQYLLRFRQIHTVFISLRKFILRLNIFAPIELNRFQ